MAQARSNKEKKQSIAEAKEEALQAIRAAKAQLEMRKIIFEDLVCRPEFIRRYEELKATHDAFVEMTQKSIAVNKRKLRSLKLREFSEQMDKRLHPEKVQQEEQLQQQVQVKTAPSKNSCQSMTTPEIQALIRDLKGYISYATTLINNGNTDLTFFRESRGLNRRLNRRLAEELVAKLEAAEDNRDISAIFSQSTIAGTGSSKLLSIYEKAKILAGETIKSEVLSIYFSMK